MSKKVVKKVVKKEVKNKLISMPSPIDSSVSVFVASEFADDQMIEREMLGEVMPHFIYQFESDGKTVTGLSVKGVSEVVRRLNINSKSGSKIHINPKYFMKEEVERDGQKGIEISVFAEDLVSGNSAWGLKFEPYFKEGRRGRYSNTFAVEKALSKAERNAKRKLIPEVMATKIIQKMISQDPTTVKKIDAPSQQMISVTPAVQKPSTPEELAEIIMNGIKKLKNIDDVISWDEKAQLEKRLSKNMKEAIHTVANNRVSEIENNVK